MLDIKFIRENKQKVKTALKNRGIRQLAEADLEKFLAVDKERRALIGKIDEKRSAQKKAGKDITRGKQLKQEIKKLEAELKKLNISELLAKIPNMPAKDVPVGKDESKNKEIKKVGKPKKFSFKPKNHQELGKALDIIDMERAVKVAGARFTYLKGGAAALQFALIQYVYDLLVRKEKFIPIIPPVMLKAEVAGATGHPETTSDEAYHLEKDDLYLIGTSEQSILPMYKNDILDEAELPLCYLGYSTCFRREAGSYGKDTQGIMRQHQFDKLEMFVYCQPKDSEKEHKNLLALEEKLVKGLGLPYRVMNLCTGDLGAPSVKTYDIETWMPSQNKYRETHSTSNCTDYQARGLNIKYKTKDGKKEFVHTLNGTAVAIGRTLIAIIENNQQKDGSIAIPTVLQKYCGIKIIKK